MLWAAFGWKVALIYSLSGILLGVLGGWIIGALKLEHLVEDYVYKQTGSIEQTPFNSMTDRFNFAWQEVKVIVSKVWKFVF